MSFSEAWSRAQGESGRALAPAMDAVLHRERREAAVDRADLGDLPIGAFVAGRDGTAFRVISPGEIAPWRGSSCGAPRRAYGHETFRLLTPPSVVAAIRKGYLPEGLEITRQSGMALGRPRAVKGSPVISGL